MWHKLIISVLFFFTALHCNGQSVAISLDKEHVAYAGVDNPLTIEAEKVNCKDLIVTTDNGKLRWDSTSDHYTYVPSTPGKAIITVSMRSSQGIKELRQITCTIKALPKPEMTVAGRTKGDISRSLLCVQMGPSATRQSIDFSPRAYIYRCKVTVTVDSMIIYEKDLYAPSKNDDVRFDDETIKVFRAIKANEVVSITDARCTMKGVEYTKMNDVQLDIIDPEKDR